MVVVNVKTSISKISKSMTEIHDSREFLLKNTRDIVTLCSKCIIAVHSEDMKNAKINLRNANKLLNSYRKKTKDKLKRYLIIPEQEFVEASALISIVENKEIPSKDSLNVSDESYVLGLLDCIGELKRFVLDKIRKDDLKAALFGFEVMEELFSILYPLASFDKVIKETRRKLDINRMLVEDTRSVITEEIRRNKMIDEIKSLKN